MPFDAVPIHVDFPAQESEILRFWDAIGAFERLRAQNRGKPRWSFLDGPITANNPMGVHHAWGRTYKDAYQRYFAMTGHERALPERLRLPGPVGRGRGREGAEAADRSATSRTWCPATASRASTGSCSSARSASTSSRASRRSSRSASATGWTGTAPTRTGPSRRTSASRISRCRRRTTTRSGAS